MTGVVDQVGALVRGRKKIGCTLTAFGTEDVNLDQQTLAAR